MVCRKRAASDQADGCNRSPSALTIQWGALQWPAHRYQQLHATGDNWVSEEKGLFRAQATCDILQTLPARGATAAIRWRSRWLVFRRPAKAWAGRARMALQARLGGEQRLWETTCILLVPMTDQSMLMTDCEALRSMPSAMPSSNTAQRKRPSKVVGATPAHWAQVHAQSKHVPAKTGVRKDITTNCTGRLYECISNHTNHIKRPFTRPGAQCVHRLHA